MNHYELLAIISGKYAETEIDDKIQKLQEFLTKYGNKTHYLQNMGRRKLAYPIKHIGYGYYILAEFDASPDVLAKLNRDISLSQEILRHLIVSREKVGAPTPFDRKEIVEDRKGRSEIPAELRTIFTDTPAPTAISAPLESVSMITAEQSEVSEASENTLPEVSSTEPSPTAEASADDSDKKKKKVVKTYENLDEKLDKLLSGEDIL